MGRRFWLGETLLEATRLSTPCRHIEEILGKAVFDPLINRSGLNCKILQGGTVRVGDPIRPAWGKAIKTVALVIRSIEEPAPGVKRIVLEDEDC